MRSKKARSSPDRTGTLEPGRGVWLETLPVRNRDDDQSIYGWRLATAHATKGLEIRSRRRGRDGGRTLPERPGRGQSEHPARAYEEERRLAYVAWTRARRSLTLLYDPTVPSPFLLEAFSAEELGLATTMR